MSGDAFNELTAPGWIRQVEEARKARRRLYPVTVVYTLLSIATLALSLRPGRVAVPLVFYGLGFALWTWLEYEVHRHLLHGRFPDGPGAWQHFLHRTFDHLHVEHHERPWDGNHINGTIRDTGPFLLPAFLLALALPPHTLLAFLAGLVQAYVAEEWVHHSVHYYHFDNLYFRYIKRHHLYHHSRRGREIAFGLTSGVWDVAHGTRIPADVRAALYGPLRARRPHDSHPDRDNRLTPRLT